MSDHDRKWIIGASTDCDLVVSEPIVSGRHCSLELLAGKWFIEDLGSTNGVYVNGTKLTQRQQIVISDHVTLGRSVPLPWPASAHHDPPQRVTPPEPPALKPPLAAPSDSAVKISIGRAAANDVVIHHPSVSSRHAILLIDEGQLTLRDLQSSNGTFLGSERNRIQQAVVAASDSVVLGDYETTIANLLLSSDKTIAGVSLNLPPLETATPTTADAGRRNLLLGLAAGGSVALLLVVMLLIWNKNSADELGSLPAADATHSAMLQNPVEPTLVSIPEKKAAATDALYALILADPERKEHYRIGSAIAIGPRHLLTSATCKAIANLAQQRFPNVVLQGATTPNIKKFVAHPTYLKRISEGDEAERKFKELIEKVKQTGAEQDVQSQLRDAYQHYMTIAELPHHFDVAVIEVDADLPAWLPIAPAAKLPPQTGVSVWSFAFDRVAPYCELQSPAKYRADKGRVRQSTGMIGDPKNPRLLVAQFSQIEPADHLGLSFTGAAILDAEQRLIAIYSRVTPERELNSPPTGKQFDATVVADLSDFFQPYFRASTAPLTGNAQ
ncbi:FHA domain-containing protein [Blastopirellula marina]|uniref:FHA domain protein n=1 Tax=Blastopirellula marina DSM 3645 TaxID=314230 RepID=A3ZSI1_9BACT|nr:FHA domain-containing protein [Blastopirellula marina]EAQ80641.1 FHA domain protein [Blastopirellula marina DSM 3645]